MRLLFRPHAVGLAFVGVVETPLQFHDHGTDVCRIGGIGFRLQPCVQNFQPLHVAEAAIAQWDFAPFRIGARAVSVCALDELRLSGRRGRDRDGRYHLQQTQPGLTGIVGELYHDPNEGT